MPDEEGFRRVTDSLGWKFRQRLGDHMYRWRGFERAGRTRVASLITEAFARSMPVEFYAEYRLKAKTLRRRRNGRERFRRWFEDRAWAYFYPEWCEMMNLLEPREKKST